MKLGDDFEGRHPFVRREVSVVYWCYRTADHVSWFCIRTVRVSLNPETKAWSSVAPRRQTLLCWGERDRERETAPSFPVSGVRWNIYEALCQGAVLVGATELQHGALPVSRP